MLRMYLLQNWFNLSDEGIEDAIYDTFSFQRFPGINFLEEQVPDATTLLNFRHLLEEYNICKEIIVAPSSIENAKGERDPEKPQTKKGNQWYHGMKVHAGVDAGSGYVHTIYDFSDRMAALLCGITVDECHSGGKRMKKILCGLLTFMVALLCAMAIAEQGEVSMLTMQVDETPVQVEWEANASVDALKVLAQEAPIVIQMSMYGGFEQVGFIGQSLPRNDEQTTTHAGDIVLYSGNQLVVFYGSNSWAYTRLGRIVDKTPEELMSMLGNGSVTITLDVPRTFLRLPSTIERLEREAFAGVSAEAVILPDVLKEIAPDAFANSDVRFIYGHANTLAETYSDANGFIFVPIN